MFPASMQRWAKMKARLLRRLKKDHTGCFFSVMAPCGRLSWLLVSFSAHAKHNGKRQRQHLSGVCPSWANRAAAPAATCRFSMRSASSGASRASSSRYTCFISYHIIYAVPTYGENIRKSWVMWASDRQTCISSEALLRQVAGGKFPSSAPPEHSDIWNERKYL